MAEGGRWKKNKERKDKGREKQKKKREERREKRIEEEKRRRRGSKEEEQPNSLDVAALDQLCIFFLDLVLINVVLNLSHLL